MARKCLGNKTKWFRFELPIMEGKNFITMLTVEGYGCMKNGKPNADIDSVIQGSEEIKPALEMLGGMVGIDAAAENHVQSIFEDDAVSINDIANLKEMIATA